LGKQVQDKNYYYTLYGVWSVVRDDLYEKTGRRMAYQRFSKIVRAYLDVVLKRVIYKHQEVQLYNGLGTLFGTKILCTKFNPWRAAFRRENGKSVFYKLKIDVMKDDGYFYFIGWRFPLKFHMYRFKVTGRWKQWLYANVKDGSDYPELECQD